MCRRGWLNRFQKVESFRKCDEYTFEISRNYDKALQGFQCWLLENTVELDVQKLSWHLPKFEISDHSNYYDRKIWKHEIQKPDILSQKPNYLSNQVFPTVCN